MKWLKKFTINKETKKSIKRGLTAVAIGVVLVIAGKPEYAFLSGAVPFLMRWGTPSDKDITFVKEVVDAVNNPKE